MRAYGSLPLSRVTTLVSETEITPVETRNDHVVAAQREGVENRKAKKARKTDAKLDANPPRFLCANSEIIKRRDPGSINDIRDLVLHVIADAPPPSWIRVQNPQSIQKIVVLLVPGLTSTVLSLPPLPTSATENLNIPIAIPLLPDSPPPCLPAPPDLPSSVDPRSGEAGALYGGDSFILRTFSYACPIRAPRDANRMHSALNTFFQAPVGVEKKRHLQECIAADHAGNKDPAQYLLTKPDGWIETPQAATGVASGAQTVYAIDCEMVNTSHRDSKALTQVRVIDFATNKVMYDELVKPSSAPQHNNTPSTTLLSHSLESDLRTLQLAHPHCIDTALIFHHPRGRPLKSALAWLTHKWLGRTIQDRGPCGHDSEEDARACIDLLKAKINNGAVATHPPLPLDGRLVRMMVSRFPCIGLGYGEFRTDYKPILVRIPRSHSRRYGPNGEGARTAIVDHGNPGAWHGTSTSAPATTVPCTNDTEVLDGVLGVLDAHEFVFARLMGLADALGCAYYLSPSLQLSAGTR
ncbi:hypothetical protein BJV78DRAFT_1285278 [Lactifluus subvellereus]|nr:hypothetical protein BJV78DRAFT_1285278 [Lactifluus subvellereus]